MNKENNLAEKIPKDIRKFRYENSFIKVLNPETDTAGLLFKNTKEKQHFHYFQKDNTPHLLLTIEKTRDHPKRHIDVNYQEFLKLMANLDNVWPKIIKMVQPTNPQLKGKKVILADILGISVKTIKKKTAYFHQEVAYEELNFEHIDPSKTGIGAIINEKGEETDMIIVGGENIGIIDIKKLEAITKDLESKMNFMAGNSLGDNNVKQN